VKPVDLLGQTLCPDGTVMKLMRRDDEYLLLADEAILMSSRMHGSVWEWVLRCVRRSISCHRMRRC
jgi:hypothetical protein